MSKLINFNEDGYIFYESNNDKALRITKNTKKVSLSTEDNVVIKTSPKGINNLSFETGRVIGWTTTNFNFIAKELLGLDFTSLNYLYDGDEEIELNLDRPNNNNGANVPSMEGDGKSVSSDGTITDSNNPEDKGEPQEDKKEPQDKGEDKPKEEKCGKGFNDTWDIPKREKVKPKRKTVEELLAEGDIFDIIRT